MNHRGLLIGLFILINLTLPCFAKEWRNIYPLKTTRAEVIKILGEPKKNRETGGEYFNTEDGTVTIGWIRPDCFAKKAFLQELPIKSDALVYAFTFVPKEPLPNSFIQAAVKEMSPESKTFIIWDGSSLRGGSGTFSSNLTSAEYGFGYSNSHLGVHALYYFPISKELDFRKANMKSCLNELK